ncbi:hypothetical protein PFISCL1PPCAC_9111, partial [Pristionchus fissidentatus]
DLSTTMITKMKQINKGFNKLSSNDGLWFLRCLSIRSCSRPRIHQLSCPISPSADVDWNLQILTRNAPRSVTWTANNNPPESASWARPRTRTPAENQTVIVSLVGVVQSDG